MTITDFGMPRINGIHLYYKTKAINPYIPMLLVSILDLGPQLVDSDISPLFTRIFDNLRILLIQGITNRFFFA
jgi:hypothetical protein